ncbi:MAG: hypothetical protein C5B52_17425 [Bacteroidetes bacterium]|nr:MAG: hypothetical protein C5B52_17425 [Bacteroidota bacterium]
MLWSLDRKNRKLRMLIRDYSFAERRNADLLRQIDELIHNVIQSDVRVGMDCIGIRKLLGQPYEAIGEKSDEEFKWMYPSMPPLNVEWKEGLEAWKYCFEFRNKKLVSVSKRKSLIRYFD